MSEIFRQKSEEELREQVEQTSDLIPDKPERGKESEVEPEKDEQKLVPPSQRESVYGMSVGEIKEKFPRRYEMYLKTLREQRKGKEIPEGEKLEMADWLSALNNLDNYIETHRAGKVEGPRLREDQITVFDAMRDFLEEGKKDGYIKLPTGTGKTVVFTEFMKALKLKTLIVAPGDILIEQTSKTIKKFAPETDYGTISGSGKTFGKDANIITYDSLRIGLENGTIKPEDYKCLILDEAHLGLSEKRIQAIEKFKHAIRLGFTATPDFAENKKVKHLLPTEIYNMGVTEAAEEGLISGFSCFVAKSKINISNVGATKKDYKEANLSEVIDSEPMNNSVADLYKGMFEGQAAVAYCVGVDHAIHMADAFNKKGIKAAVVSGRQQTKKEKEEQEKTLEQLETGEIMVVCNANLLVAGFDSHKVSVCLNVRPTMSAVMEEQRSGRALRLDNEDREIGGKLVKANPDKHATIVNFTYINDNEENQQVLFSEIAGASVVLPLHASKGGGGKPRPEPEPRPIRVIEGLEVVTSPEEVMKITKSIEDKEKAKLLKNCESIPNIIKRVDPSGKFSNIIERVVSDVIDGGYSNRLVSDKDPETNEEVKLVPRGLIGEMSEKIRKELDPLRYCKLNSEMVTDIIIDLMKQKNRPNLPNKCRSAVEVAINNTINTDYLDRLVSMKNNNNETINYIPKNLREEIFEKIKENLTVPRGEDWRKEEDMIFLIQRQTKERKNIIIDRYLNDFLSQRRVYFDESGNSYQFYYPIRTFSEIMEKLQTK